MKKYEDNWWMHFVPECYFDTVILKALLKTSKRVLHRKGCNNVVNELKDRKKDLFDDFAVAIIDKDKKDLDYLKDCILIRNEKRLILWKHDVKNHFIIQIDPPIEKWIIEILSEHGLNIEDFGYPSDYKELKRAIKEDIDSEDDAKLKKLVRKIIDTDCSTIILFRNILNYLKENNYSVDINELKNV
jgi:hypothetical protein